MEMLWHDLKKAVHAQKPSNVADLQQDDWAKIPSQDQKRLIVGYRSRLIAFVAAQPGPTRALGGNYFFTLLYTATYMHAYTTRRAQLTIIHFTK